MAAVQLMYSFILKNDVIDDLLNSFFEIEHDTPINKGFLKRLVARFADNSDLSNVFAQAGINVSHTPLIIMCVLKVAVIELFFEKTDAPVIINEYLNIAKCFVDKKELAFINVVLDKISKVIRCKK